MPCALHDSFRLQVAAIIPELRRVFVREKQVDTVVNRHHQFRWTEEWRLMMRHVNDVNVLAPQRERDRDVMSPQSVVLGLVELFEIRAQRTKFVKISLGTNQ